MTKVLTPKMIAYLYQQGWRDGCVQLPRDIVMEHEQAYHMGYMDAQSHVDAYLKGSAVCMETLQARDLGFVVADEPTPSGGPLKEFAEDPRTGARNKGSLLRKQSVAVVCPLCDRVVRVPFPRPVTITCPYCKACQAAEVYRIALIQK